jgi:enoyl-CoA hydratase
MTVERTRDGHIVLIEMRREDKANAIDREMAEGIDAALNELDDDPDAWVGVLTGTTRVFSAGTDLRDRPGPTSRGGSYGIIQRRRIKPLIAAVEGPALGGGFEIALACDLVVAGLGARFGLPEVTRGVIASCGGLFRSARALPLNVARELLLTGESIDALRAERLGLVNVVAPAGGAVAEALKLAGRIIVNSPIAVRESLRALERYVAAADDDAWELTTAAVARVQASNDSREGVAAFFEKRPPRWTAS